MAGIIVRRSTGIIERWTLEAIDEVWPAAAIPQEYDRIALSMGEVEGRKNGIRYHWDGTKIREATPEEVAKNKTQAVIDEKTEETRQYAERQRKIFAHPQGLTRALVRVLARRLGEDPKVLMAEVRAEAGL